MNSAIVVLITTIASTLGATPVEDIQVVKDYWTNVSPHPPREPIHDKAIEPVDVPMDLRLHRAYSLLTGATIESPMEVVAIGPPRYVFPISDQKGFNRLLLEEGIQLSSVSIAEQVARCFLVVSNYGWKGRRLWPVLESVDDIDCDSEAERVSLVSQWGVGAPRIVEHDGHFEFTAFSWSSESGLLSRVKFNLTRDSARILDYEYTQLKRHVCNHGRY